MSGFVARLQAFLGSRAAFVLALCLGLAGALPSLDTGFVVDDHFHRLLLREDPGVPGLHHAPLDLFRFASGDPAERRALMEEGVFPWTTAEGARLAFWRPLAALTHGLDHAILPESAVLAHAHNVFWFVLLLAVVGLLYRALEPAPWVAGLATLLYALDDAHGPTFGWVANRSALIAAVFGLVALWIHDRWRRHGSRRSAWLAPLVFAACLGAGESGVATGGYLVAHAVCLDPAPWRRRFLALAPYAGIGIAWLVAYRGLGYGTRGSGVYVEPTDVGRFAGAVATHLPVLIAAQLSGLWSEIWFVIPASARGYVLAGVGLYLLLALDAFKRLLGRDRLARFWALGMALAAVPISSTFPSDRLLVFVGVGAFGLIACLFHRPEGEPGVVSPLRIRRFSVKSWVWGLGFAHLALAPLLLPIRARSMVTIAGAHDRPDASVPKTLEVKNQTIVLINPPSDAVACFLPLTRASRREPRPGRIRELAVSQTPVLLERLDTHTLRVRPEGGWLQKVSERMLRNPEVDPMRPGDTVALSDLTVTVTEASADGRPLEATFRFARPLEDPGTLFLAWDEVDFHPWPLPKVGERVTLPAADLAKAFFGPGASK
jgi:hypothetical protein